MSEDRPIIGYAAERGGKFRGFVVADSGKRIVNAWIVSMATSGATIRPFRSREEYDEWLKELKGG